MIMKKNLFVLLSQKIDLKNCFQLISIKLRSYLLSFQTKSSLGVSYDFIYYIRTNK